MTNTQLSNYLEMKPSEIRNIFDHIRDAFEEANLARDIEVSIADLYINGSTPANYHHYLKRLDAVKLLREQGGYEAQEAEMIVKSGFYDPWIMLQSAAYYSIDRPLPKEFESLVLNPSDQRIDIIKDSKKQKDEALKKAQKTIGSLIIPLKKVCEELSTLEPWTLAGTQPESIRIEITKILDSLGEVDGYGNIK